MIFPYARLFFAHIYRTYSRTNCNFIAVSHFRRTIRKEFEFILVLYLRNTSFSLFLWLYYVKCRSCLESVRSSCWTSTWDFFFFFFDILYNFVLINNAHILYDDLFKIVNSRYMRVVQMQFGMGTWYVSDLHYDANK